MTMSSPATIFRNSFTCIGLALVLAMTGCQPAPPANSGPTATENALSAQNAQLTKQLQDANAVMVQQQQQLAQMKADLEKLKGAAATSQAPATTPRPGTPAAAAPRPAPTQPAAATTGPTPQNLPYSLYTGILQTGKGEMVTLTSVNFGKINRVPLVIEGGSTVEVNMDKIRFIRRIGKYNKDKKTYPVRVEMIDGEEIRAGLPEENVKGVDPRFGSTVEIPFSTITELEFVQPK